MRIKHLLIYSSLIIFSLAGCTKQIVSEAIEAPIENVPVTYKITENFENVTKDKYLASDINISTGSWNFDDALVGNLAADLKNGQKSVRLRTGSMTMNFDVSGLKTLYISHGKFGNDKDFSWQLLMSEDGGTTFTQLGKDIEEKNTKLVTDSFQIEAKGKVRFQIRKTSATDRVNIDDIVFKGTGESGIIVGAPDTDPGEDPSTPPATTPSRDLIVAADAQPLAGDDSNALFGNPSAANGLSSDNFLLDMRYYVQSYSSSRGTPNWVSWHLDPKTITQVTKRLDNFAGYTGLPANFYQVSSTSYYNSGFDRGHNCPSADRTSSTAANGATFLMNNMIPQAPNNNQGPWADFENYLRAQVVSGNEVYIIMGSYGVGGIGKSGAVSTTIDNGKVTVPGNVWKVAVIIRNGDGDATRVSTSTRVIALNTPNINTIDKDWKKHIITVRDIEKATGYNLLSALPQGIQDVIEMKKDAGN
ncbi:DNA/RNA non-specific endonuclease [Pedobacter sp. PLR]|uniref:DNA/RNA non-specific endonuclease n=1 Tax=Pedobacter sp. PLR TaxID=2994465 RepID=UPI0022467476|nr:DNA/RNA non-specific endonuclease [Pedobacter sp. PLR]MCX2449987.1 DNA/RNA non-specific endonuclease [Pedobacter sp. PLR]